VTLGLLVPVGFFGTADLAEAQYVKIPNTFANGPVAD
jgi:hypothetical protein